MLEELENQIFNCTKCSDLAKVRLYPMPGFHGSDTTKLMIIGINPGPWNVADMEIVKQYEYDYKKIYEFGIKHCSMGNFISKLLENVGLTWDNLFFTNLVKCATPNSREPTEDEFHNCKSFIEQQIESINPKRYVLLGNFVSQHCGYNNKEIPFVDVLRQDKIFVIHHPTYLRRTGKEFLEINFVKENWNAV